MKLLGLVAFLVANVANVAANSPAPPPGPPQVTNRAQLLQPRGCNANNCARAVTGTRPGKVPDVSSRKSDCSSFMATTVLTYPDGRPWSTVTATAVPTYASACSTPISPASAYASACSCWGVA